ncbi:hypothetical protein ACSS6W_002392 [Trichoderma asperelloides]
MVDGEQHSLSRQRNACPTWDQGLQMMPLRASLCLRPSGLICLLALSQCTTYLPLFPSQPYKVYGVIVKCATIKVPLISMTRISHSAGRLWHRYAGFILNCRCLRNASLKIHMECR